MFTRMLAHALPTAACPPRGGALPRAQSRQLDPQALSRHIDSLYRAACFMCRSREDAEDLVQETFARVLRKPRLVRADDDLGYLLRVLRNTWVSGRRAAARRPQTLPLLDTPDLFEDRAAATPDVSLELVELYEAVARLPDTFRDVLIAVDMFGLSYREAGDLIGVGEATITTRLYRARQRLARQLAL
jgi:RNA polymerase sigma-70 factor (ECF subfamily)